MTQEDKELLLKDLCARLPYHPKGHVVNVWNGAKCDEWLTCATFPMFTVATNNCRLYLRPMSSMTDEEFNSLKEETALNYNNQLDLVDWNNGCKTLEFWLKEIPSYVAILVFDWLNSHHFDYRALIDRGLALEAPEGIYK